MLFCTFRWKDENQIVKVNFVSARARVTPPKSISVPRLELQAAVLATRLINAEKESSRRTIVETICWSDSKNVQSWIRATDKRFQTFVSNRVAEIHDSTRPAQWRYIPSHMNIADKASRGQTLEELVATPEWFKGPYFLRLNESMWPTEDFLPPEDFTCLEEKKALTSLKISSFICADRFSRWTVAVRTVATMRRWLLKVRKRATGEFEPNELQVAEQIWIKVVQAESYAEELSHLRTGKAVQKSSRIYNLSLVLLNGVICVDSKLKRSPEVNPSAKFPPILLKDHHYTRLLNSHIHALMRHRANEAVLVELHQCC